MDFALKAFSGVFALAFLCVASRGGELLVDDCSCLSSKWSFGKGEEFPGAEGGLSLEGSRLALRYDFSKGGRYVAASRKLALKGSPSVLSFRVEAKAGCSAFLRVVDSAGRSFQGAAVELSPGAATLRQTLRGPWASSWGGGHEGGAPLLPLASVSIGVDSSGSSPKAGLLALAGLEAVGDGLSCPSFKGEEARLDASGWSLRGSWEGPGDAQLLRVKALPGPDAKAARLAVLRDGPSRPLERGLYLEPGKPCELVFDPALGKGASRYGVYSLRLELNSGSSRHSSSFLLRGSRSAGLEFGEPKDSSRVSSLPFGTCVHFNYGERGAFSGWADFKRISDLIAAAGFKWIRDSVSSERGPDGNLRVSARDRAWIEYAKSKGVATIALLEGFEASRPKAEIVEECAAVAASLKGLVDVFELGNEPNNFGGWRQLYPSPGEKEGAWNGMDRGGSSSRWLKESLERYNAAAEAVKAVRPDATLVGLGAPSPANFRYIDLGVSKALSGVVEHPYSLFMPPERVPYGWGTAERDGVLLGDKEHSFKGLVDSYSRKFDASGFKRSLWVTEFGWSCYQFDGSNEGSLQAGYAEEAQAAYLLRRFILGLSLPIAASCQYDFMDDYGSDPGVDEANFGIVRSDLLPKPAYGAIQRMNSLLDGWRLDSSARVSILKDALHHAMKRSAPPGLQDAEGSSGLSSNSVIALPFVNAKRPGERLLALWSAQPYSGEFSGRSVSVSVDGWGAFGSEGALCVELLKGGLFETDVRAEGGAAVFDNARVGAGPSLVKVFAKGE